jgi:hypothetical protein
MKIFISHLSCFSKNIFKFNKSSFLAVVGIFMINSFDSICSTFSNLFSSIFSSKLFSKFSFSMLISSTTSSLSATGITSTIFVDSSSLLFKSLFKYLFDLSNNHESIACSLIIDNDAIFRSFA